MVDISDTSIEHWGQQLCLELLSEMQQKKTNYSISSQHSRTNCRMTGIIMSHCFVKEDG